MKGLKERKEKSLHPVELLKGNSKESLERLLIFCLLDRAMPYEKVCKTFEALDVKGLTKRENIKDSPLKTIIAVLKSSGFRFPNQTGAFIKSFGDNSINLSTATREELVEKVPGIGMKLASMFLRNTRDLEYAVIDVHLKRFLAEKGKLSKSYLENEQTLIEIAKDLGMSVSELDFRVWEERRIGNKRG